MNILVTGGAGYIGSHTVLELLLEGHQVVVIDNLVNSSKLSIKRVESLVRTMRQDVKDIPFYCSDLRNRSELYNILQNHDPFDCCIHFAGLKSVGESIKTPISYYDNNIGGTVTLLDALKHHGCKNFIFSSSATVYGNPAIIPITEECPKGICTNPYGWTKSMIEQILLDVFAAEEKNTNERSWNIVILRYFNPVGAHPSGCIGEDPNGTPNNLMPYITQVAIGRLPHLNIFGNDYETQDGTGVRDYIHVVDLARGHVKALSAITRNCGFTIYNLGTGRGYSVLDVIHAFEQTNGIKIPYEFHKRRPGDIAVCYSSPEKAERELGWKAIYNIEDMCRDSWNWQKKNPNGYQ